MFYAALGCWGFFLQEEVAGTLIQMVRVIFTDPIINQFVGLVFFLYFFPCAHVLVCFFGKFHHKIILGFIAVFEIFYHSVS